MGCFSIRGITRTSTTSLAKILQLRIVANYFTIKGTGEGLVREKMSRFLSFAIPVKSVEDAMAKVKEYQNKYHDSRHVCWAYMLGADRSTWHLNDNGEPSGTAGKPILGQINSKGVTDVVVIVVRYFGGIKLGTSGLIAAYREAAKEALEATEIIECHEMTNLLVEFSYMDMDGIMKIVKGRNLEIIDKDFDNLCRLKINVKESEKEEISGILQKNGAKIEILS